MSTNRDLSIKSEDSADPNRTAFFTKSERFPVFILSKSSNIFPQKAGLISRFLPAKAADF